MARQAPSPTWPPRHRGNWLRCRSRRRIRKRIGAGHRRGTARLRWPATGLTTHNACGSGALLQLHDARSRPEKEELREELVLESGCALVKCAVTHGGSSSTHRRYGRRADLSLAKLIDRVPDMGDIAGRRDDLPHRGGTPRAKLWRETCCVGVVGRDRAVELSCSPRSRSRRSGKRWARATPWC